jgi:hypothetical protein
MKTEQLASANLEWAVALAQGQEPWLFSDFIRARHEYLKAHNRLGPQADESLAFDLETEANYPCIGDITTGFRRDLPCHTRDKGAAFLLMEEFRISVENKHDGWWMASTKSNYMDEPEHLHMAKDPATAICRTFVSMKLGPNVDIPLEVSKWRWDWEWQMWREYQK